MGTEILPLVLTLAKVLIGIVLIVTLFISVLAGMQLHKEKTDHAKREELKKYILNSLIALTIVIIVYVVLLGIGPAFNILFGRA